MTIESSTAMKRPRAAATKAPVKKAPVKKATATKAVETKATTPPNTRKRSPMSDDHKTALAQGRLEGRIVTNYLNALETNRPKRGRKRTAESIARRLEAIDQRLLDADPINRLQLIQERMDLQAEASRMQETNDLSALEEDFIRVARSYGERKGITKAAWVSMQVPKDVVRRAGI